MVMKKLIVKIIIIQIIRIEGKKEEIKVKATIIIIIIIEEDRDHFLEVIPEMKDHIHIIIEEKGIIEKEI